MVVLCSHSGTTPETVNAAKLAREKGAITIAFSNEVGSPLWEAAEYGIQYDWGPESDAAQSNVGMLFKLVFNILNAKAPNEKYERALNTITKLKDILREKEQHEERQPKPGSAYKRALDLCHGKRFLLRVTYALQPACSKSAVGAFQRHYSGGTSTDFEITDYDVPFVGKGLDETRPWMSGLKRFARSLVRELL